MSDSLGVWHAVAWRHLVKPYKYVLEHRRMDAIIEQSSQPDPTRPPLQFHSQHARGPMSQYVICLRKFFITFWRNPE